MITFLRFPKYKSDWLEANIDDIAKVTSGGTPSRSNNEYWGGNIPWITTSQINFKDIIEAEEFITETGLKNSSAKLFSKGTILLALYGQGISRGRVSVLEIDATTNQACAAIILKSTKTNIRFIFYYLQSKYEEIRNLANDGGQKNLSGGLVKTLPVVYPDCEKEQQKIASFLTSVDSKISQLTEKHRLLKEYKKGVMQQVFSQQLRFKDKDGKDFPEWEEIRFGDFLTLDLRKVTKPGEKFLALGVRSHVKGVFHKPNFDPQKIAMEELYVVKKDDLVLSITFAWEGAIAIASNIDEGGLVSHRFPTFIFELDKVTPDFFKHVIPNLKLRYILGNISPGGAGRNRVLNKNDFLKIKWNMPSLKEQQKIAQFLQSIDKKIDTVAQQVEQTKQFKKGLLQQMFV